jgi:putative transcriptional regulator
MELLSNKIREYRFRNSEMTQKELVRRVSVSRQTMNAIENCRHVPTVAVAIRIADVFCVSVDQLFELDYEGKAARREQVAKVATDRSRAASEKPIEIEGRQVQLEETSTRQITLASLRNVIGS